MKTYLCIKFYLCSKNKSITGRCGFLDVGIFKGILDMSFKYLKDNVMQP